MVVKLSWMFWGMASSVINKHRSTKLDHHERRSGMLLRPDRPSKGLYREEVIISETYKYKYKNG